MNKNDLTVQYKACITQLRHDKDGHPSSKTCPFNRATPDFKLNVFPSQNLFVNCL